MKKVEFTIGYAKTYRRLATKLNRVSTARQWAELEYRDPGTGEVRRGVPAEEAARWANRGYFPGEAKRHLEAGRNPAQASAYDAYLLSC